MKLYLAGPDVFRSDAVSWGEHMTLMCKGMGWEGLYPMDNKVDKESHLPPSFQIFTGDVAMMEKADVIVANISPFRGPGMDPGTAMEIGYCFAKGKQVFLYSEDAKVPYAYRVSSLDREKSDFPEVEDFGLTENLMIIHASTDGKVHVSFLAALMAIKEYNK